MLYSIKCTFYASVVSICLYVSGVYRRWGFISKTENFNKHQATSNKRQVKSHIRSCDDMGPTPYRFSHHDSKVCKFSDRLTWIAIKDAYLFFRIIVSKNYVQYSLKNKERLVNGWIGGQFNIYERGHHPTLGNKIRHFNVFFNLVYVCF